MIEIRTLGRTLISVDGVPLAGEAAWPRSLALIVYMAREPGPDRRAEILALLWPDREEKRARRALNQLIYTLRKTSPALDLESIEDALDFGTEVWLDVEEFERRIETGDLERAVELCGGPFLVDLMVDVPEFDHWADRQRADVHRKFRKAALELAERAKQAGASERALEYCRKVLEFDQLDDEAQHLLIECLYLSGDRVAALRRYDSYRELLQRELQVEPLDPTVELAERIRAEPVAGGEALPVLESPAGRDREEVGAAEAGARRFDAREALGAAAARGTAPTAARTSVVPEIGKIRTAKWLSRRGLALLGGVAVALLAVAFIVSVWPRAADRSLGAAAGCAIAAEEATQIAVPPFRTHGLSDDQQDLGVAVAQLLAMNLEGSGQIGTVNHRAVVRLWEESGLDLEPALMPEQLTPFAAELGASSVLLGTLHSSGAELRLIAELVSATSGEVLARADVQGSNDNLFDLTNQLTLELLEGVTDCG